MQAFLELFIENCDMTCHFLDSALSLIISHFYVAECLIKFLNLVLKFESGHMKSFFCITHKLLKIMSQSVEI